MLDATRFSTNRKLAHPVSRAISLLEQSLILNVEKLVSSATTVTGTVNITLVSYYCDPARTYPSFYTLKVLKCRTSVFREIFWNTPISQNRPTL
jgi:hypothetical protein